MAPGALAKLQRCSVLCRTWFGSGNLLWSPFPFLTVGVEYTYGRRNNTDGSDTDNHRLLFGFQVF